MPDDIIERLQEAQERIGRMCKDGRPPKMSVPVQESDDDVFIVRALQEASAALSRERDAARKAGWDAAVKTLEDVEPGETLSLQERIGWRRAANYIRTHSPRQC